MTILVFILVVVVVLTLLFVIAGAIFGKEMNIERSITINRPLPQVFDFLKFLRNHDKFNVWARMDPDMKKEYRGADGKPGFVFAWDSSKKRNVGAGEQEITRIDEGRSLEHELRFFRPMQDIAKAKFVLEPASSNQTKVQWGFYSKMKFPMNAMKPLIQNMLAKNLETGLQNLKTQLEK